MSSFENGGHEPSNAINSNSDISFIELAKLNAGVILEPLASDRPVFELPDSLVQGLASLPKPMVKEVIKDHTEPGIEARILLDRFDETVTLAKSERESLLDHSIAQPKLKDRKPRTNQEKLTIDEEVKKCMDANNEVDFDELSRVINRHPTDPRIIDSIDSMFNEAGIELDLHENEEITRKLIKSITKSHTRYLWTTARMENNTALFRLIEDWSRSLTVNDSVFSLASKYATIEIAMSKYNPQNNVNDAIKLEKLMVEILNDGMIASKGVEQFKAVYGNLAKMFQAKTLLLPENVRNRVLSDMSERVVKSQVSSVPYSKDYIQALDAMVRDHLIEK